MCGFFGIYGSRIDESTKKLVDGLIAHRGPDGYGSYAGVLNNREIFLHHRRLAIIDIDKRSLQPMSKENIVLIFNGEIYNYKEIRFKLIELGHTFFTESDTEVILEAYREWGVSCVDKFEGMWALVLLDRNLKKIWFCRDRFGEKPLYWFYSVESDCLYFASEIKVLVKILGHKIKPNYLRLENFIVNGYRSLNKTEQSTWFKDIYSFSPGSYDLIDKPRKILPKTYWSLDYKPDYLLQQSEMIDQLKSKLKESLSLRLRSDVPIAFCLSGGVDSSLLLGMAVKEFGLNPHCFSIIDSDLRYNELTEINTTINKHQLKSDKIYLSDKSFIENMRGIIQHRCAPISTISYYAHNILSKKISDCGFKVAISGTGADELFSGYYDHYNFWLAEYGTADLVKEWECGVGSYIRNEFLLDPYKFRNNSKNRDHIYQDTEYFMEFMSNKRNISKFAEITYTDNLLRNRMMNELFTEVVPVILNEDDLNSMMYGIENRSPYLDKNLVEFAYTIPNKLLVKNGFLKWPLRMAGKNFITERIRLNKEKKGFNASIETLLNKKNKETVDYLLSDSDIFNIVNIDKIEKFLKLECRENHHSKFLFSFLSAKIFLDSIKEV